MGIADRRIEYGRLALDERGMDPEPLRQFESWFAEAVEAGVPEPTAMTLATATVAGVPSVRTVLLKGVEDGGFTFYTNYHSRKGRELTDNPVASLLFFWQPLERQVRIGGSVSRVSRAESERYFASRPLGSRLGAWVSAQSEVIAGREPLETGLEEFAARFADGVVPCPPHWGGFRVHPVELEFWQGRANRLHDRIRYRRHDGRWLRERLAP